MRSQRATPNVRWLDVGLESRYHTSMLPELEPCTYCGDVATSVDHVPPRAVRSMLEAAGLPRPPYVEVPACKQCNSMLGMDGGRTVAERKRWAKRRLREKLARDLRCPEWTDREVSHLGPGLQRYVLFALERKRRAEYRVNW